MSPSPEQSTPVRTELAAIPGVERSFLFGDERPFAQCHASTLVESRDGRFVVAFFAGTRERHPDVAIWIADSRSGGRAAFDPPRLALKIADVAHWNPVLYRLDRGIALGSASGPAPKPGAGAAARSGVDDPIALQFKIGPNVRRWETWIALSHDGGGSFDAPAPLVPGDRGGRGAVRNKPIRLASGDFLAGASRERWRRWDAFFDRSPNGIDGWQATATIGVDRARFSGKGLIQPALWESSPGRVHALFRTTDCRIHRSDSDDDGRRWSTAHPLDLPHNNSGLDVARLADGTLALACNPVPGASTKSPRTPLSLLFSRDEGRTWPWRIDVETGPGEFSYPALVASGEGLALCYTWNRRRIAFLRIASIRDWLGPR